MTEEKGYKRICLGLQSGMLVCKCLQSKVESSARLHLNPFELCELYSLKVTLKPKILSKVKKGHHFK